MGMALGGVLTELTAYVFEAMTDAVIVDLIA